MNENIGNIKTLNKLKLEELFSDFRSAVFSKLSNTEKETLNNLHNKLKTNIVNFVVIGQFKRGKSTFINALLGDTILPTGVIPLTSIITIVRYSPFISCSVYFNNGTSKEIKIEELRSFIAEKENPGNIKNVKYTEVGYPSDILKRGMIFIDTPGVGSLHLHNTRITVEYISKIDAAIFITSVDPALSEPEISFLEKVLNITDKIFIIINKVDYLNQNELEEFRYYTESQINKRFENKPIKIFYVSSKEALKSKISKDKDLLLKSGFIDFENNIINYFENEKENILIDSIKRQLVELINEVEISLELEIKSLSLPVEEIKEKINLLTDNLNMLLKDEKEYFYKLKKENETIIENYRDRLHQIKTEIIKVLRQELANFAKENENKKISAFKQEMENFFREQVQDKIEDSRIYIEKEIKQKSSFLYQSILRNFNIKINQIYKATSEIFNFELKEIFTEIEYSFPEEFEYITYDFKLMFNFDKTLFAFFLPSKKQKEIILNKYLDRIEFTVNYNFGYIIEGIQRRMERNLIEYNIALKNKLNETINRIKDILNKVIKIKEHERVKYDSITQTLTEKILSIREIKQKLLNN